MSIRLSLFVVSVVLILSGCIPASTDGLEPSASKEPSANKEFSANKEPYSPLTAKQLANALSVQYQVITNRTGQHCDPNQTDGLCFQAKLTLKADVQVPNRDWSIYFSHLSPIQVTQSSDFDIQHINGDLHKLVPSKNYTGLQQGQAYEIPFTAGYWHLSESDVMPNYYLVLAEQAPQVIASTRAKTIAETQLQILPHAVGFSTQDHIFKRSKKDKTEPATAAWIFAQNQNALGTKHHVEVRDVILPTPVQVEVNQANAHLDLSTGWKINDAEFDRSGYMAALDRAAKFGIAESENGIELTLNKDPSLTQEAYRLAITEAGITLVAASETGVFYGIQSLLSALMPNRQQLPLLTVEDAPRFAFRGMHLDVARNFKSKQFVLQLLEQMAAYKLNAFHFHLADDEGWRVEIDGLAELTEVGAYRCHDLTEQTCLLPQLGSGPNRDSEVNGYYSIEDYQEILAYAQARHIQVIPSMDMPGHARAAIKAMQARFNHFMAKGLVKEANEYLLHDIEDTTEYLSIQYYNDNTINVCLDSSYRFIEKVIDELALMHQQAGQALTKYHLGADETAGAWLDSPACKARLTGKVQGLDKSEHIAAHFIETVAQMLAQKGIQVAGWSDGMGHTAAQRMPALVQTNAWTPLMWQGQEAANEQANRGWQVVISSPDVLYFDFPYQADTKEPGYYWATRHIDSKKVFEFMPENLAAMAEVWTNRQHLPYTAKSIIRLNKGRTYYGMQGQLWSETVRTDKRASYMIFPRLYALAERAWHKADWEMDYDHSSTLYSSETDHIGASRQALKQQDWRRFANAIGKKVLAKATQEGVFYRLPTPGARIEQGKLVLNNLYPGLPMEYQFKGGHWQRYRGPIALNGEVKKQGYVKVRSALPPRAAETVKGRKGRELVVPIGER